jgi:hypothetical protein
MHLDAVCPIASIARSSITTERNFSHTHQMQLLTGFCEETLGTSTTTNLVCPFAARMVGTDRCTEIGQNISVCSVDAVARTQPANFNNSGPTLIAAPLANNGSVKAVPMNVPVVKFNTLRFVLRQHYSSVAWRTCAREKQGASRSPGRR